ncbi:MAG: CBS domain-containing protein [Syntrophobacteraceae bacterium]
MQLIIPHKNVDFDALASLAAASMLYEGARPVLPTSVNQNVRSFLAIHKDLFSFEAVKNIDPQRVERLIVVDTNRWARLEGCKSLAQRRDLEIHLWDHHPGEGDIEAAWKCAEPIGATVTLLVEALKEKGIEFSTIHATLLLAGIYEDTGHLTFPTTTPRDLRAAAYLLEKHADLKVIQTILRPTYGPKQKEVLLQLLSDARRVDFNGFKMSVGKLDIEGFIPGLAEVVSMYRSVVNVDVAFGIFKDTQKDRCMVIGRSGIDSFDVGAVMRLMGGGGHSGAGSAMITSAPVGGVETWLLEAMKDYRQMPVQISDLMSFPVESVSPDAPVNEVSALLDRKNYSGMPVMDNGKLVGIISRRDINKLTTDAQRRSPVKAFMSRKVITVTPMHSVAEAMRTLIRNDIGRLPVVEDDRVIGIISRSDAMIYYYDLIPE